MTAPKNEEIPMSPLLFILEKLDFIIDREKLTFAESLDAEQIIQAAKDARTAITGLKALIEETRRLNADALTETELVKALVLGGKQKPLSDERLVDIWAKCDGTIGGPFDFGRAIEQAHGIAKQRSAK